MDCYHAWASCEAYAYEGKLICEGIMVHVQSGVSPVLCPTGSL